MGTIIFMALLLIAILSWGYLFFSGKIWNDNFDERNSRCRYQNMDNDEYEYGHNVKHYSNDED